MRILQIYEMNPLESIGGVELSIWQLSKELVKLGHEVTVLSGAGNYEGGVSRDGLEVISFDCLGLMKRTYSSGRLSLLRQLLFLSSVIAKRPEFDFDIYHGHIYTSGIIANFLARQNHGLAVNTVHGSYYPVWNRLTNPLSALFYKTAEKGLAKSLAKRSGVQIHVSSYFAEQVSEWGCDTTVIPNGVDTSQFHDSVEPCFDSSVPVILTARRLVKKNGVDHLIRAMNFIEEDCKLVIIGDGPERSYLEGLAKDDDRVEFIGSVAHRDMPGYLAGADIAVVPSIIEASSLFMLEAMAMGKPVVASSVGGLPEVLGDTGILVPPGDPLSLAREISGLISDPDKGERFGRSARSHCVEFFEWSKIARRVEDEYLRLWSDHDA